MGQTGESLAYLQCLIFCDHCCGSGRKITLRFDIKGNDTRMFFDICNWHSGLNSSLVIKSKPIMSCESRLLLVGQRYGLTNLWSQWPENDGRGI
jgi:hypothetical protein